MKRSGFADLPLHGGRVPPWLSERMQKLGTAIVESIVHHYGAAEFLSRLSDPFWFQALHSFVVSASGDWAVVQQGMNKRTGLARCYHWHSASVRDFVCEPDSPTLHVFLSHTAGLSLMIDARGRGSCRCLRLANREDLIGLNVLQHLFSSRRPSNL